MNDLEITLKKLKEKLNEQPEVVRYFELKKQIESNKELSTMVVDLKVTQKEMTKAIDNKKKHSEFKKKYEEQILAYETHPLIVNFKANRESLNELLTQLSKIIQ